MRRTIIGVAVILIVIILTSACGLAANQDVHVMVPARALIIIWTPNITFNIPSIGTWPVGSETYTQASPNFYITTLLNTFGNSNMVVSSSPLQSGTNGPTIPLSDLSVDLVASSGSSVTDTLDKVVVLKNIGAGIRTTRGIYNLTVNAAQQAGRYTGTVTYTLVNN